MNVAVSRRDAGTIGDKNINIMHTKHTLGSKLKLLKGSKEQSVTYQVKMHQSFRSL